MKAYLIDFENVKSKGLTGIEQLSPDDKVIIFYSENSDTLNFEMHRKIMTSSADIEYLKVRVGGKNALDFQLSTLLGYLLAKEIYTHIFIISGDKGFDKLHDFWNVSFADRNNITVFRTPTLAGAVTFAKDTKASRSIPAAPEPEEPAAEEEITAAAEAPAAEEPAPEVTAEAAEPAEDLEKVTVSKGARKRGRKPQSAAELIHNSLLGIVDLSDKEAGDILACAAESDDKEDFHNRLAKIFKGHATDIYKVLRPKYLKIKEALEDSAPVQPVTVPEKAPEAEAETKPAEQAPAKETKPVKETKPSRKTEAPQKQHLNDSELFDQFLKECEEASKRSDAYEYKPQEQLVPEAAAAAPEPAEIASEPAEAVPEAAEVSEKEKPAEEPAKTAPAAKPRKRTTRRKTSKAKTSRLAEELGDLLKDDCSPEEIAAVTKLFEETDTKQRFYLGIVKKYRKDRGCEIYKLIKSEYSTLASYKEN
ncbi:MAG: hypothetical protein IJR91_03075 [Ruminococcus sp.]|nr:hypothetical protein [Ruminococcus sp.]